MHYYLGIDGGGTRTTAAVSDENGKILLKQIGKTINFYSVGMETARNNLAAILAEINAVSGITEYTAAFIGCSALDDKADKTLTDKLCKGIIPAEKIMLHSDLYIALRSLKGASCPCVAVCGTGSMAIAENKNGKALVTGGWGHIIGDEGSAYAISVDALRKCTRMHDKGEKSAILDFASDFFDVKDFRNAIDIIYNTETTKDIIAGFAEYVGKAADSGNTDAKEIITYHAETFADTVLHLLKKTDECDALGLYGGVFQHNESFTRIFSEKIEKYYPSLVIKLIDTPPEESATELARNLL